MPCRPARKPPRSASAPGDGSTGSRGDLASLSGSSSRAPGGTKTEQSGAIGTQLTEGCRYPISQTAWTNGGSSKFHWKKKSMDLTILHSSKKNRRDLPTVVAAGQRHGACRLRHSILIRLA